MSAAGLHIHRSRPDTDWKHIMDKDNALRILGTAGLAALIALPAYGQEPGLYIGLSGGQSRAKIDSERITAGLLGAGLTTTAMTRDESDKAFRIFGGYKFNRNFALEAGYFNLGKFGFTSTTTPAGTLTGQIKLEGLNLDLVGTLPLGERWSVLGRVGAQSAQARDRFSGTGAVSVLNPNPSKRETNIKYGAGVQYAITPAFLMRAEVERYRINDAVGNHGDVNTVLLSAVFGFGKAPEPARRAAVAPAPYVEPVRMPDPVVVAAPIVVPTPSVVAPTVVAVIPPRRRVSFAAESLFAFDHSDLRPEGKIALDRFVRDLAGLQFDVIVVEGHAGRMGSTAYNQTLSEKRADVVKAYLVSPGGLDGSKITAVGRGESNPVTKPGDCPASLPTAKLIECLQPDRRVEIEVTGTKR